MEKAASDDKVYLNEIRCTETLPGSIEVTLDKERLLIPECLFDPSCINSGYSPSDSLPSIFLSAKKAYEAFQVDQINRNNLDFQTEEANDVFKRVYITGGSTKMPGMVSRIRNEVSWVVSKYELEKMGSASPNESEIREKIPDLNLQFLFHRNEASRGIEPGNGALKYIASLRNNNWVSSYDLDREDSGRDWLFTKCPR